MKQIIQDLSEQEPLLAQVPAPRVKKGHFLVRSKVSLISAGTERMLVDFAKASYIQKARQQPDKVKMVLEKIKADGLFATIDAVRSKLSQPIPLGYSNVGVIEDVASDILGFAKGDRVVSNGPHSELVRVPKNLTAKIPDNVSDEEAAFTVLGSIALQGVRLAEPTLGENFVVIGAGLIGLLSIQILKANGCQVLAVDYDSSKLDLAQEFGAEICDLSKSQDAVLKAESFSKGKGVDGVLITASTSSNEPVSNAAKMCRQRGRIILVGVTGLSLNRADFYQKELNFQVSCSYGPGRHDDKYEQEGHDYPYGLVRWTQKRNFEAVLDLMSQKKINTAPLISHVFDFNEAPEAYKKLTQDKGVLGLLLKYQEYSTRELLSQTVDLHTNVNLEGAKASIGLIGAGNYASRILIPALKKTSAQLHSISTSGGLNSYIHGEKAGFIKATTDTQGLISNSSISTLIVATQHDTHSTFVVEGLKAGKNVFVEKPLAIDYQQLEEVKNNYDSSKHLMVGFNRRFAPQVVKMKQLLDSSSSPKSLIMTMNAGFIPKDHWTQDPSVGGGRIIGEACHYIDLMRFFVGHEIISVNASANEDTATDEVLEDNATITLRFKDGSMGTIHYFSNGASSFPKERVEVFTEGKVLQLDNFRKLKGYGWKGFKKMNLWRQDKGQVECINAFIDSVQSGGAPLISFDEIYEVTKASLDAHTQIQRQRGKNE